MSSKSKWVPIYKSLKFVSILFKNSSKSIALHTNIYLNIYCITIIIIRRHIISIIILRMRIIMKYIFYVYEFHWKSNGKSFHFSTSQQKLYECNINETLTYFMLTSPLIVVVMEIPEFFPWNDCLRGHVLSWNDWVEIWFLKNVVDINRFWEWLQSWLHNDDLLHQLKYYFQHVHRTVVV